MVFLLTPFIFLMQKPVITDSAGIDSLLRKDEMMANSF